MRVVILASVLAAATAFSAPLGGARLAPSTRRARTALRMGVDVVTTKAGNGVKPKKGQLVRAHYTGKLTDGTQFDSSRGPLGLDFLGRGPFEFTIGVGQVIKGWDVGMAQMSVGEKATLTCSSDFGYGKQGSPPDIPGGATLVFDVELLAILG